MSTSTNLSFLTTCYPTVSSGVYGNSGDKMSKEYVECSGKGKKAKPAIYQALERVWDEEAAGSNPVIPTTSKQSSLCFDFFMQKSHPPTSLLLLFHKKSRSAHLLGCKRPHDDSLSLPTFCEFILTRYEHSHHIEAKFALLRLFYAKKSSARFLASPLSQKVTLGSPARL